MTKTMRWGVGTISIVGLVGFGSFIGCSSDNGGDQLPVTDTDSGVTPLVDSAPGDSTPNTDTPPGDSPADTAEAPPPAPDRKVTFVFASPDSKPQYMCLGAFGGDPMTSDKPTKALGPFGIPDPSDPTKLVSGFPYRAVVPYPVTDKLAQAALSSLTVAIYFSDTDPTAGGSPAPCVAAWATAKTDPKNFFIIPKDGASPPKGVVAPGTSWALTLSGCRNDATDATDTCPKVANFAFDWQQLDTADPSSYTGGGTGAKAGLQFHHLSNVPAFNDVDVYIQPMSAATSDAGADADGGTATPASEPILIAGTPPGASGVKFGDMVAKAVGVAPKGDPDSAVLLLVKHGDRPGGLTTIPLPLDRFLAAYKAVLGPTVGWTGNQTLILAGSPNPSSSGKPSLVIAWVANKF